MKSSIENLRHVYKSENTILNPVENKDTVQIVEQSASLFAIDTFHYFIINYVSLKMEYASEDPKTFLSLDSIAYALEKYFNRLHPENLESIHNKGAV